MKNRSLLSTRHSCAKATMRRQVMCSSKICSNIYNFTCLLMLELGLVSPFGAWLQNAFLHIGASLSLCLFFTPSNFLHVN